MCNHLKIPSLRNTGRPDLLDMVEKALVNRREEVQEVEEGARAKRGDDDDGSAERQITEEARDAVDGAAALNSAQVGKNLCWNCGTPGEEGKLCTCKGCRKVGHQRFTINFSHF